ncbi:hypothetical protein GIW81_00035 [Hyphomicrobium sp. xq]|uniref:YbaB/EbfC family DNA-binding protein n=1 Tax=Hyphomicrobium album TaxID=2665159 RepID=A0A6I3KIW0_9HYPH|nr:hypothetical protein [Hyphomicrobium album]MTD92721.1 hypothetical protein [Hyphomicrobium album]
MKRRDRSGGAYAQWVTYTLASAILAAGYGPAMPQQPSKSAAEAPLAWREFSARLKAECEKTLQADDETARRLQATLETLRASSPDQAPLRVLVSVWVGGVGDVDRISFQPLPTEQASADLKTLLSRATPGAPPADMLQPVRLMLSLTPRQ